MSTLARKLTLALGCVLAAQNVEAHFFGTSYSLPIPFWMYAYGATAALIVSFALVGYFVNAGSMQRNFQTLDASDSRIFRAICHPVIIAGLRLISLFAFLMVILTGLFGNPSAYDNLSMTLFWVAFALGFTYLTAFIGDLYAVINPLQTLCRWFTHIAPKSAASRRAYPAWLGYWPALTLYILYIWVELFGHTEPRSLATILIAYSAVTLAGAWIFGVQAWMRYGEFFAVFLRLIAKMAPIEYGRGDNGRRQLRLRQPFIGLVTDKAENSSLVLFVLFMLSSTAFDGAHETLPWVGLFWKGIYPLIEPLVTSLSRQPYAVASNLFYGWQWLMLAISPLIYYGIYSLFIAWTKVITRSELSVRELGARFAFTLIPIAFVYNVTHYYTLLITEGPKLLTLVSDPFGEGWNLLGTRDLSIPLIIPGAGFVWHTQVWLILVGHIVSVYLAHLQALQIFGSGRRATLSQVPMLLLMVIFTTVGLWILSLPIGS